METQTEPDEGQVNDPIAPDSTEESAVQYLTEDQIKQYKRQINFAFGGLLFQGIGCIVVAGFLYSLDPDMATAMLTVLQGIITLICAYVYKVQRAPGALIIPIIFCVLALLLGIFMLASGHSIAGAPMAIVFLSFYIRGYKAQTALNEYGVE